MDKEQLSEVFSLAEYLGFDPKTEINSRVFNHVCNGLDTYYIPDLEYYLVLCEIQLWLLQEKDVDVFTSSNRFTGYIEIGYFSYSVRSIVPLKNYRFKTVQDALATGILEALKLIKNENN